MTTTEDRGGPGATVRPAGSGDVDALVEFGAAVVPPHYEPILGRRAARAQLVWWTAERLSPAVDAGRVHVATSADGAVVGICETGEAAGEQVIWKLYVAPGHRGRSLGVGLLGAAISALPAHATRVDVEHFAGNSAAARFYEREGFVVTRTEPAPPGAPPAHAVVWRRRPLTRAGATDV